MIDTEVDGKLTKTATHAGRNGYLWILDRDRLEFLHAYSFANNNVFTSIDPKTGRPTIRRVQAARGAPGSRVLPGHWRRQRLAARSVEPADQAALHTGER